MKMCRVIALVLIVCLGMGLLTGCEQHTKTGNPTIDSMTVDQLGEALVRALNERASYKQQSEDLQARVDELEKMVQGIQFADPEFPAIDKVEDDTGRVTFKKPGDYIKLPDPMRVPGDVPAEVNNKISMGGEQGITMKMAPIWTYRIEGNKLWLSSTTGVYGVIVIGQMKGVLNMDLLNTIFDGSAGQPEKKDDWGRIIQPYIPKSEGLKKSVPADPGKGAGKDEDIYWNKNKVGRQVILNTSVEGNSAVFRAGAFAVQSVSVMYVFMYETEADDSKEAIILSAIQSITIQNVPVSVAH